jgi:SRSO17 transposase
MTRAGARFSRAEPRRRARAFVLGLLAELPRKNCWTIAEHAGDRTPDGMQHLLSRARWDADGVRDDVRSYVVEQLGDPGVAVPFFTSPVSSATSTAPGSPSCSTT